MNNSIKSQALSGVKWSAISKVYTSVMAVLQIAVLTRFLAKEDFGLMGIAVLVNAFSGIFVDMGMSTAAMHEQHLTKPQFSSFYWFNIFSGFTLFLIVSLSSPLIANYYKREELIGIISFSSFYIFLSSISSLQRTIQQKQLNFSFMSIVDILSSSIGFFCNVLFAINGCGVYSLVWSQLLSSTFVSGAYLYVALFRDHNIMIHFNIKEIREALKIGIFQMGTATLEFFSRNMDSFLISSSMTMELFGIYTLCKNLSSRIYLVINPIITNVLTPMLAKIQEDKEKLTEAYIRCVEIIGYVNFPIYYFVVVCSYSILSLLYGASYGEYAFVMACLSIFYAYQSCGNPIGSLLIATGRTDRGFYWTIFRIIFTICFLSLASLFDINLFATFIAISPLLTIYPSWRIILKEISTIDFKTTLMLYIKPMLACLPLIPLYMIDHWVKMPLLSIFCVGTIFIIVYLAINQVYRPQLQKYVLNTLKQEIIRKK